MPVVAATAAGPFLKFVKTMFTAVPGVNLAPMKSILKTFVAQDWTLADQFDTPELETPLVADTMAGLEVKSTPESVAMSVLKPVTVTGVNLIV